MIRTSRRLLLCAALLTLLLGFIWGNSLLPGEISQAISNWVQQLLFDTRPTPGELALAGNGILRKLAHFTEFTALGMTLGWLFGMLGRNRRWPLLTGMAAGGIDELIQSFVPERAPRLLDVGIDSLGVLTGIILLHLGHTYLKKRSANQSNFGGQ
nr:VanZ family protein [Oscillospiraceae bacterium]